MLYALRSVILRLAAMSRSRAPGVLNDTQQDPGVFGQEATAFHLSPAGF